MHALCADQARQRRVIIDQKNAISNRFCTSSVSMLCEPSVAVVDSVADARGTREAATEYLKQLYTEDSQRMIAKHFYRPSNPKIQEEFKDRFPALDLVKIDDAFGGWHQAHQRFFADGGIFDQIYKPQK